MRSTCEDDNCPICNRNDYIPNCPDDSYQKPIQQTISSDTTLIAKLALSLYEDGGGYPITHIEKIPIENIIELAKKYSS